MNKALVLIVTHNVVIGLTSKGSIIAFGAYVFMVNLNMHICKFKRSKFKGFATCNNEGFTFFVSQQCFFMIVRCKEKEKSTSSYIQNCGYTMPRASINLEFEKR
jgi:hypothetical protein